MQSALQRGRKQDAARATTLTGGLGDSGYRQDISKVTLLGRAGQ